MVGFCHGENMLGNHDDDDDDDGDNDDDDDEEEEERKCSLIRICFLGSLRRALLVAGNGRRSFRIIHLPHLFKTFNSVFYSKLHHRKQLSLRFTNLLSTILLAFYKFN